jgi:hypothetical protein
LSDGGRRPTGGIQVKYKAARITCAILTSASLTFISCASAAGAAKDAARAAGPAWMNELDSAFPESKYLAAVGSGDTRRDAESDAVGALARQFTVNVQVDSTAVQRYAELVKGDTAYNESERTISQTVGTRASEQFVNLRFTDPYTDAAGTTHTVAYIEREPTAAIYRNLIGKDLNKVDEFRGRGRSAEGALQRYALFDAAYQVSLNAQRLLAQLRIIHAPSAALLESDVDATRRVVEDRDAEASKLAYRLEVAGDSDGKIAGIVRNGLSTMSLSSRDNGPLAVRGTWLVEPVEVNPKYKSVRWSINLSLFDEKGTAVATVVKEARENAIGDAEARAFAYREAEKIVSSDFPKSVRDYLTRVAVTD